MEQYVPDWLHLAVHSSGGVHGDRIALVVIVAFTLLLIHLINSCLDRSAREKPLIRRLAEMDKKLFAATNELLLLKKEASERPPVSSEVGPNPAVLRQMELEVSQAKQEAQVEKEGKAGAEARLARMRGELEAAVEETRQAQEMVEELLAEKASSQETGGGQDAKLLQVVQQLQEQLESQRGLLQKYEPKLRKKEKENKELSRELKQLRADVANANLEVDKMTRSLAETNKAQEASSSKLEESVKQEEEWKQLADLLQAQLDQKSEEMGAMEDNIQALKEEVSAAKSRVTLFKNEAESKEEQLEILQETLEELKQRKKSHPTNGDENGWEDMDGSSGWDLEDVTEVKELATLRIENRKAAEHMETLERQMETLRTNLDSVTEEASRLREEATTLREVRDEVVKDRGDVQRRLDVLTEFFNKKEAELQKQLGLQSAKFGDVSTDAESTARKLISVTSELESTHAQVKLLRTELEDQEKSLKATVAAQEKKAHENWVAARQAERKLTELQSEMSVLRNRLTLVENKNTLLEQEKEDLTGAVQVLQQSVKAEPQGMGGPSMDPSLGPPSGPPSESSVGAGGLSSPPPSSTGALPPLPGLPGMQVQPSGLGMSAGPLSLGAGMPLGMGMSMPMPGLMPAMGGLPAPIFNPSMGMLPLDSRPPPIGRMSPTDRGGRSSDCRSPSPEYDRPYRSTHRTDSYRDHSPTSRSERRGPSPVRRGPSPTRSERGGYRDRNTRDYQDYSHRDSRDRYYSRDLSPDRYSYRRGSQDSSRHEDRDRDRERERERQPAPGARSLDYLKQTTPGPKTSSPMDPTGGRTYGV